ncbi:uncharacterized protein LOC136062720 [Quercus suber]|uniref:uncharacterized protein LOC136062720 n=1 Tax=Quercus suber TaxID=58331 RepID=UPI0032DF0E66
MVKKANGKWKMCVDFTDLNKTCPKDNYPLPHINQFVDSTAGHQLLSFMDAFSGYNQIKMDKADQEKTSFITSQGLFCYKVMPFGLKNVGATYQRVSSGKFLGFMVSQRGIEANPDKIQAILNMEPPKNIKEIQSLTGRVVALNKFVSKATDKCLPFLGPEVLSYYASIVKSVRARRGTTSLFSSVLARSSRKLRHYFQVHVINVMTNHPLKKAMNKLEAAGRLIQWAVELSEFDIRYQPRNAIKAQSLVDFIAEFTPSHEDLEEKEGNKQWVVHVDGSSTLYAGGIGVVLQSPEGDKLKYKVRLQYQTTNNEVEYEALLKGLELAKSVEAGSVLILGDSQEEIIEADTLAKEASANEVMDKFDEIKYMPSIDLLEILQIEGEENWMTPIVSYVKDERLLEGKDEARKLRVKSARYVLVDEVLYKRDFSQPYLRTTVRTPTGETPFKLAYGSETVIPAEMHIASHRVMKYQDKENNEQLRLNLDLLDEVKMDAEQRTARYKNLMAKQHDAMVKSRRFSIGGLILKKVSLATKNPAHGKLGPNWEGPYKVINSKRQGSYYLEALDERK